MRKIPEKKRVVSVLLSEDDYIGLEALMFQYKRRSMSSFIRDIIRTLFMHELVGNGIDKFFDSVNVDMGKKWKDQQPVGK